MTEADPTGDSRDVRIDGLALGVRDDDASVGADRHVELALLSVEGHAVLHGARKLSDGHGSDNCCSTDQSVRGECAALVRR